MEALFVRVYDTFDFLPGYSVLRSSWRLECSWKSQQEFQSFLFILHEFFCLPSTNALSDLVSEYRRIQYFSNTVLVVDDSPYLKSLVDSFYLFQERENS